MTNAVESALDAADREAVAAIKRNTVTVTSRAGQTFQMLVAGGLKYRALWTRDLCFASAGALSIVPEAVADSIDCLCQHARADGLVPRRIGDANGRLAVLRAALRWPMPTLETVRSIDFVTGHGTTACDSNTALIWLACQFVRHNGQSRRTDAWVPTLRAAIGWLSRNEKDGLLTQGAYADWKDLIDRRGAVLYTNCLYYRAMIGAAEVLNDTSLGARADALRVRMRRAFHRDDGVLADVAGVGAQLPFSPDGNLLAVLFGIVDRSEAAPIFARIDLMRRAREFPLAAAAGSYPWWRKSPLSILGGVADYQDAIGWPWLDAVEGLAALAVQDAERAARAAIRLATAVMRDNGFYEAYDTGHVLRRLLYRSEPDFTWSAGLYHALRTGLQGGLNLHERML